jgi:hypothetical protein
MSDFFRDPDMPIAEHEHTFMLFGGLSDRPFGCSFVGCEARYSVQEVCDILTRHEKLKEYYRLAEALQKYATYHMDYDFKQLEEFIKLREQLR